MRYDKRKQENGSGERYRFIRLLEVLLCFLGLALFVFVERRGVGYQAEKWVDPYLPVDFAVSQKPSGDEKRCLLLYSEREDSKKAVEQFDFILTDMRVGYRKIPVSNGSLPEMSDYDTVIVAISNLSEMGESVLELCQWVEEGGRVLFALPFEKEMTFDLISAKLGISESSYNNSFVESIVPTEGFMIGGDHEFPVTDPYDSSLALQVNEKCTVYARAGNGSTPLIWSCDYGKGRFVVDNLGFFEKAYRGFYAASYSLLEDICVYPVINGSSFYIDDFPSPVPNGDGTYIKRDYGMSVADFYTNVWWPDMMRLSKKHGMVYTGLIIENYENRTYGELPRNGDISRYQFFGNMLLADNGELGFHGYNHQPLCLDNFDFGAELGYKTWESYDEMIDSIEELTEFSKGVFPKEEFSVYVPPSNILSKEGRKMLSEEFPEIRCIASMYFPGEAAYEQEFEVADDGMIETPRIISGCEIGDYMRIAALSELNLHFVNSHFLHPDDLLDEDRGAAIGWEKLKASFSSYLDWLYSQAPAIRNLTGSQMAGAVERYSAVSLWKLDTPETFYLTTDGLYDDAYLLMRVNEGSVGAVKGGELTHLTGNLYLLHVTEYEVEIDRNR